MNMKKLVAVCIVLLWLAVIPTVAQENSITMNETNAKATPNIEPTISPASEPAITETATLAPTEGVGPTVVLRTVNDMITAKQDGRVELFVYNPLLNDVTLTMDVQISVPSEIHICGEGYYNSAAGMVAGNFELPPGTIRTIQIPIKGEKVGIFNVHFTALYWPDDRKADFKQISLTHPFEVVEISDDLSPTPTPSKESHSTYVIIGLVAMIAISFIALIFKKPQNEANIDISEESRPDKKPDRSSKQTAIEISADIAVHVLVYTGLHYFAEDLMPEIAPFLVLSALIILLLIIHNANSG